MGSAWNQLEQMLTCAICLDKFKNPRLLPCQHSFCGDSCMDGLVDYARRQIKCPECRAEHRIPYNGLQNLPLNVTLIRFLELHSRITGEDTEPLPTFMEKCSICSEKIEGVTRCAHCEKKVCPDCKEAHIDILRREVGRVNGQSKRCLSKLKEFREQIDRAQAKLKVNHAQVKKEIQESCRRLIDELEAKQKRLVEDVDLFAEQEQKSLDKLSKAAQDELLILDSNSRLADERFQSNKFQWTDVELWELKEIYARAMEFIRLFDADLGDFSRKIRFMIIPEFDSIRKRLCELGELKFADSTAVSMSQALQYCNAIGQVAQEIYNQAAQQQAAQQQQQGAGGLTQNGNAGAGYSLSTSNSNSNMLAGGYGGHHQGSSGTSSGLLELPGMQNALMRSQSDHRLASQFQQRLKQQQREREQQEKSSMGRYGRPSATSGAGAGSDYDSEATLRSRYAPPRSSIGSKDAYDLTRDWPRPSDSDTDFGGGSIQFKSAFMRRKHTGNQYGPGSISSGPNSTANTIIDDDDDLISEASYGGASRNVRFNTGGANVDELNTNQLLCKLFDVKELEHAPFSGVPKLEDSAHLAARLHQMGAKAIVEKKQAEEEKARDKDLIESAKEAMNKAKLLAAASKHQQSDDDVEKQKKANSKTDDTNTISNQQQSRPTTRHDSPEPFMSEREPEDLDPPDPPASTTTTTSSGAAAAPETTSTPAVATGHDEPPSSSTASTTTPATQVASSTASSSDQQQQSAVNSRRNLYSQAITEKSRRQLANAIHEATVNPRGRRSSRDDSASIDDATATPNQADSPSSASSSSTATRTRRMRSSGRSMSKQSSTEQLSMGSDTGTIQRRPRRLVRAETTSFQQSSQDNDSIRQQSPTIGGHQSKNSMVGSVDKPGDSSSRSLENNTSNKSSEAGSSSRASARQRSFASDHQTTNTTDDDEPITVRSPTGEQTTNNSTTATSSSSGSSYRRRPIATSTTATRSSAYRNSSTTSQDEGKLTASKGSSQLDDSDNSDKESDNQGSHYTRSSGHRKSREFLPNAVNKLLDRSAQIRRDSQEARGRGDSPQRQSSSAQSATTTPSSNYYSSTSRQDSQEATSSYPSSRSNRYAYQRQPSSAVDDENNSSNSVYTTASSGTYRKSSNEDDSLSGYTSRIRKTSTGTTDSSSAAAAAPSSSRRANYSSARQISGDTNSNSSTPSTSFQSRFLSRSRTSSTLADSSLDHSDSSQIGNTRSTSSRDRFLQSTNAALTHQSSGSTTSSTIPTSSSLYSRGSSSTATAFNQFATVNKTSYEDVGEISHLRPKSSVGKEESVGGVNEKKATTSKEELDEEEYSTVHSSSYSQRPDGDEDNTDDDDYGDSNEFI